MKRRTPPPPPASASAASAHPTGLEIELKLSLPDADPARISAQLAALPLLAGLPVTEQRLTNWYFDTPAQQLHQARAALRIRRLEADGAAPRWIQTLKTAGTPQGALSQRGEWESDLLGQALDPVALQATPPWPGLDADGTLFAQLAPVFVTEATRTLREVQTADGSRIELVLDVGAVRAGAQAAIPTAIQAAIPAAKKATRKTSAKSATKASTITPAKASAKAAAKTAATDHPHDQTVLLCELELELLSGSPDALFALADQIAQHIAVLPATLSKAERGWRLLNGTTHAPRRARSPALTPDMAVPAAAQAVLGDALGQFLDNLGGIQHADGPELVHQARVGRRRWRSALWLFNPLLTSHPLPDAAPLRPLLKALGNTRDLDVAGLETLPLWSGAFIDGDADRAEQWQAMEAAVLAERRIRRAGLLSVLQAPGTGRALLQLERWLHELPRATAQTEATGQPLNKWARARTRRMHQRLAHEVRDLERAADRPSASSDHQHHVRLLAKRTRYVLQGVATVLPERRTRRWQDEATELQTRIGAARDLMLLATLLEPLGVDRAILGFLRGVAAGRMNDD